MDGDAARRPADFHLLLSWLDPEPSAAEQKFLNLRCRLIQVFANRGSFAPEDLADETITRVASRVVDVRASYEGNPFHYFYGVARNVLRESVRRPVSVSVEDARPEPSLPVGSREGGFREDCLDLCLEEMAPGERELILKYYENEKSQKIRHRKALAESRGLDPNTLRMHVFRIRVRLRECVLGCIARESPETH